MSWKAFEELVAQIYRDLAPGATVTHNDKVLGVDSGLDRQIDVSIRFEVAGHKLIAAIQAKDYDRPADINDVGKFASVIQDVRANKGIMVCKAGFTDGARKLAQNRGIDVCNIHDAESRNWSLEISLPIIWIDLLPTVEVHLVAQFEGGDSFPKDPCEWAISADGGRSRIVPTRTFENAWNVGQLPRDVGQVHELRDPRLKNLHMLCHDASGKNVWRPVQDFALTYTVTRRCWHGSFTPAQCRGILNYEDGSFQISYLPIGAIPTERGGDWHQIDDPDQLAVTVPGCIVTTERWQIDPASRLTGPTMLRKLDSGPTPGADPG